MGGTLHFIEPLRSTRNSNTAGVALAPTVVAAHTSPSCPPSVMAPEPPLPAGPMGLAPAPSVPLAPLPPFCVLAVPEAPVSSLLHAPPIAARAAPRTIAIPTLVRISMRDLLFGTPERTERPIRPSRVHPDSVASPW